MYTTLTFPQVSYVDVYYFNLPSSFLLYVDVYYFNLPSSFL